MSRTLHLSIAPRQHDCVAYLTEQSLTNPERSSKVAIVKPKRNCITTLRCKPKAKPSMRDSQSNERNYDPRTLCLSSIQFGIHISNDGGSPSRATKRTMNTEVGHAYLAWWSATLASYCCCRNKRATHLPLLRFSIRDKVGRTIDTRFRIFIDSKWIFPRVWQRVLQMN